MRTCRKAVASCSPAMLLILAIVCLLAAQLSICSSTGQRVVSSAGVLQGDELQRAPVSRSINKSFERQQVAPSSAAPLLTQPKPLASPKVLPQDDNSFVVSNSKSISNNGLPQTTTSVPELSTAAADAAAAAVEIESRQSPSSLSDSSDRTTTTTTRLGDSDNSDSALKSEFQRLDGWYNNLANSEWGTPNSRLRRRVAPAYADGVYQMHDSSSGRPNARQLSQRLMRGSDGLASARNLTTMFAFFGQVVASEILMASEAGCPIEMHRIKIDKCDQMYDKDCRGGRTMPFYRAAYDHNTGQSPNLPREQINRVTSWIDGSFIYSTSETWLNAMRAFDGRGTLKMQPIVDAALSASGNEQKVLSALIGYPARNSMRAPLINHMPAHHLKVKAADRMFLLGEARTNQNPLILALAIVFYRWHNVLAERIHSQHPNWSDEEKFQRARRLVIASLQNIILYEYLPTLLDVPSPNTLISLRPPRRRRRRQSNSTNSSNLSSPLTEFESLIERSEELELNEGSSRRKVSNDNNTDNSDDVEQLDEESEELIKPYSGYKPDLHPGISHVFQSAAFRFGHTLIPPGLYARNDRCEFMKTPSGFAGIRLCSTWWNAEEVVSKLGVEPLLMGAASQISEREDFVLCNDIRDKLFGPMDFSRRDLAALNVMRGRDNGLADYNTVRHAFKLNKITQWKDVNKNLDESVIGELEKLYEGDIDKLDVYIGGMLESDSVRGRPGILFRRIIKEQFERLRDSDRFWFENLESGLFSEAEIREIRSIRLYDVIVNSTLIPEDAIQQNLFAFDSSSSPCPQPAQLSSSMLQPCYSVKSQSYFKGNELTYALVLALLVLIPGICCLVSSYILRREDARRLQCKSQLGWTNSPPKIIESQSVTTKPDLMTTKSSSSSIIQKRKLSSSPKLASPKLNESQHNSSAKIENNNKFYAKEWLHANLKRKIKIKLVQSNQSISILDKSNTILRQVSLETSLQCLIEFSISTGNSRQFSANNSPLSSRQYKGDDLLAELLSDEEEASKYGVPSDERPLTLIRVANNYDLVLQFKHLIERRKFIYKLVGFLRSLNKVVELRQVQRDSLLALAETKERRQQRLEHFFREAYALTFGIGNGNQIRSSPSSSSSSSMSSTSSGGNKATTSAKVSPDVALVMRTSLSRAEFADALGMKPDSLFVKQMFNCIDKDGNGSISFQEFLDTVVKYSRGHANDKLRIVFDMCDHEGRGVIEKEDFVRMLSSLVDIAKTRSLEESSVAELIKSMFSTVGLQDKQQLTYEDFKLIVDSNNGCVDFDLGSSMAGKASKLYTTSKKRRISCDDESKERSIDTLNLKDEKGNLIIEEDGSNRKSSLSSSFSTSSASTISASSDTYSNSTTQTNLSNNETSSDIIVDRRKEEDELSSFQRKMTLVDTKTKRLAITRDLFACQTQSATGNKSGKSLSKVPSKGLFESAKDKWRELITELEEHRQDIVYLIAFFVTNAVLFGERFVNYSFLSEHMDLRHVMGVGIAITRGSAASLSFCYALLLLSMCRNILTMLRVTPLRDYIPLDSHVKFHKVVAMTALVMTVLHTGGHCVNFFHVTQQPVEHLRCLTKEMQFSPESRPTFFYWIFKTVTGVTGLLLWTTCSILYVFARSAIRNRAYNVFWSTHKLYYVIYALSLLHGSSKLTGSPRFWLFFIGPAIVFSIDKIISLQTKLLQLEIISAECLPSDVTCVRFARPPSFKFLSGQWIRVSCTAFKQHEFHAFTLTSAPRDDFLSIHVRAQGPWTWKLRSLFDETNFQYNKLKHHFNTLPPRIRIEGPFGGGNQDWYKYEVAVMIGGGIGVTPYASILNDLVFGTSTSRYIGNAHKKVYFVWICPSHRNFEWFIDVLRDVESKDITNVLEMHIFITQFFHKFDLRTTMLYICERHLKRISNRSLFTGLKAVNHFGRPDISALLEYVQKRHSCVSRVGVFSCGPKAMTKSISQACENLNKRRKLPFFLHQYENFS